ncbi:enoyl-CoA hydratase-related protein [Defluviimonas sp. WL0024]|uniref:Enoyl-CoA hydratase-related protein n=2 Tax=Albidovulum TaxID=205889 RepID=A0ABT3JAE5_9RHOB|nr:MULTISPECIES: enoyl-CoA hydratase-related protein [Defluviimonas]MCU9848240.1 enoyl-CoA hydratase-related protein [Defluviimonas sp. WL0024]MCW3784663.1 enoyl-CoA hydratase-related protein [Defluviimonas salinarum]
MSGLVQYEARDGVAVLTLDRPEQRNAVNAALAADLRDAVARFEADDAARVGVLAGAGRVFCAGMDLKAFLGGERDAILFAENRFAGFVDAKRTKPMIAAVNGAALAGGLEIALACDLIVAEEGAVFGLPEAGIGIFAVAGGPFRLARRIPPGRALELALTGASLGAEEAKALGLVNRLAPKGEAVAVARALAQEIGRNAPLGVSATLRLTHAALLERDAELFALSEELWPAVAASRDAEEGPRAFAEKRTPKWAGQ